MSDDIVAFIRVRLGEDAENAARAIGDAWRFRMRSGHAYVTRTDADELTMVAEVADLSTGSHIARHDPARVLRGIEAKRQILDEHASEHYEYPRRGSGTPMGEPHCTSCLTDRDQYEPMPDPYPCATIRLLASEWSTHADYRQEWTP